MDPQCPAAALCEDLEVSARLSRFDDSECVRLPGNRQVGCIVTGDLQNDPAIGAAFVCLTSGVKKSRAEFQAGGHPFFVTKGMAQFLQQGFVFGVHLDIGQQREVVACARAFDMSAYPGVILPVRAVVANHQKPAIRPLAQNDFGSPQPILNTLLWSHISDCANYGGILWVQLRTIADVITA